MENNYFTIALLLFFAGLPLSIMVYLHSKTFTKHLKIIIKTNIFSFIVWLIGGDIAYRQNIWKVTHNDFLNIRFMGIWLGDIIQSIIGTTIIAFVAILMYEAYRQNLRFRDIFFKKE